MRASRLCEGQAAHAGPARRSPGHQACTRRRDTRRAGCTGLPAGAETAPSFCPVGAWLSILTNEAHSRTATAMIASRLDHLHAMSMSNSLSAGSARAHSGTRSAIAPVARVSFLLAAMLESATNDGTLAPPVSPLCGSAPGRSNRHSARALNDSGGVRRGFLPRGLCDTCPQVIAVRCSVVRAGQASHNP